MALFKKIAQKVLKLRKNETQKNLINTDYNVYKASCPEPESNQWHEDFQSSALPTELSGHKDL